MARVVMSAWSPGRAGCGPGRRLAFAAAYAAALVRSYALRMAPFEVVVFHHLPAPHNRAWCSSETAALLEQAGIAKRPDDDRRTSSPLRQRSASASLGGDAADSGTCFGE
jgi:hypothetical protein